MCVTANPAIIEGTRTYVHATTRGGESVHICGYQNKAETQTSAFVGGNCMFLNFAGSDLKMVRGPERTSNFMQDITASLEELVEVPRMRGGVLSYGSWDIAVEEYGDYTVILAQQPGDILTKLNEVRPDRRPHRTPRLEAMISFYMSWFPLDSFVLACFNGKVEPKHPITVSYKPRNPEVLTIPGLDGHDGKIPQIGAPVYRNFRVAFGVEGYVLPHRVNYTDRKISSGLSWAPTSVAGFIDNRFDGPNGDYVVPIEAVRRGLTGRDLAAKLLVP